MTQYSDDLVFDLFVLGVRLLRSQQRFVLLLDLVLDCLNALDSVTILKVGVIRFICRFDKLFAH